MALRLDQKARLLAGLPLLRAMEPEAVHVLAFSARERALADGERLFGEGEPSDGGFVVASGEVSLTSAEGAERFGPGTLIGASAIVSETRRPATAIAVGASSVLVLPRSLMLQVLEAHPGSAARLRAHVAEGLAGTRKALERLSF